MSDLDIFRDEFLPNAEAITVSFATWKKQQPAEHKKWVTYRDAVLAENLPEPPVLSSRFGKMLMATGHLAERTDMKVTLSTSEGTQDLDGTVTVTATAVPASQVTKMEFYVDSVLKSTDTSSPYTYSWDTTTVPDGGHELKARAFYPRNKVAEIKLSVTVLNTVTPPPPPPIDDPPVNVTPPSITGTATQGQTLSLNVGTWMNLPTSYTRQWTRCDAAGANCVNISAGMGSSYVLTAADVGATIRCWVVAHNAVGPSAVATSAQTAVVAALVPAVPVNTTLPVISGTPVRLSQLSVSTGGWTNAPTSYTYQWKRCDAAGANCTNITGATANVYALATADVTKTIRCAVVAVNASGSSTAASSVQTSVVVEPSTVVPAPANLASLQANASPGAVIRLGAGNHGNQTFTLNKQIKFLGQPGAVLGDVTFSPGSGNIEIASENPSSMMQAGTFYIGPGGSIGNPAHHITLRDINGMRFNNQNANYISIYGGDWGPVPSGTWGPRNTSSYGGPIPTDILIDGGWFHDMVNNPGAEHLEGIINWGGNGITIRNCIFNRLGQSGDVTFYFLGTNPNPQICNILVEGCTGSPVNEGYPPYAYYNVQIDVSLYNRADTTFQNNVWPRRASGQYAGAEGELLVADHAGTKQAPLAPPAGWPR